MKRCISLLLASSVIWMIGCDGTKESPSDSQANDSSAAAVWLTDFDQAKATATEKNRPMLMNFTGSDWCPPCMQLKKEVLSTKEFAGYAQDKLVLLELDFPRRSPQPNTLKRQNESLATAFKIEGFPTLVLLNPQGNELARNVGPMPGGPGQFIEWADAAQRK